MWSQMQEARHWDDASGKAKDLDFSATGAEAGGPEAGSGKPLDMGRSLVDAADDASDDFSEVRLVLWVAH